MEGGFWPDTDGVLRYETNLSWPEGAICIDFKVRNDSWNLGDGFFFYEREPISNDRIYLTHVSAGDTVRYEKSQTGNVDILQHVGVGWLNQTYHSIWATWNDSARPHDMELFTDNITRDYDDNGLGIGNLDQYMYLGNNAPRTQALDVIYYHLQTCGQEQPCSQCGIYELECIPKVNANETFQLNYTLRTSDAKYSYAIRSLYVGDLATMDQCVYNEEPTPYCSSINRSFITQCPPGAITTVDSETGRPAGLVKFYGGCRSSEFENPNFCDSTTWQSTDSCDILCLYCSKDEDLVYNVSAKGLDTTYADTCRLHMWYNTSSGSLCKIFPTAASCCTGMEACNAMYQANKDIEGQTWTNHAEFDVLNTLSLTDTMAPVQYLWNVECRKTGFGEVTARKNWTFTSACRG
jgi:hypothetical protein